MRIRKAKELSGMFKWTIKEKKKKKIPKYVIESVRTGQKHI